MKQEIKEELCQDGSEHEWVPLSDEVNWDVLMAPSEPNGTEWAWVPQAPREIDSDDEGLVLWEAPDPNGLKEAWMDICGSIPGMKKQELSAVPPAKPVAKTLPRNAQARPAEPLTEKGTARSSGLLMAKMEVAEAAQREESKDRPQPLQHASAKAKRRPKRPVYQQPGAKPKAAPEAKKLEVAKTPMTPPKASVPPPPREMTSQGSMAPRTPPKASVLPPPPPPEPANLSRSASAPKEDIWEAKEELSNNEEVSDLAQVAHTANADSDSEEETEKALAEQFKTLLLNSSEAIDVLEAAVFRHTLWQGIQRSSWTAAEPAEAEAVMTAKKEEEEEVPWESTE
ncbi:unnamed protein product [Durusdinium trenchii]|uniref:Uncharacterized protein n=2 Tax=Durusdinium trenchii TaxID=1381693 RepID=A0ABP0N0I4_9DINO